MMAHGVADKPDISRPTYFCNATKRLLRLVAALTLVLPLGLCSCSGEDTDQMGSGSAEVGVPTVSNSGVYGLGDVVQKDAATYGGDKPELVPVGVELRSASASGRLPEGVEVGDLAYVPSSGMGASEPVEVFDGGMLSDGWMFVTVTVCLSIQGEEPLRVIVGDMQIETMDSGTGELSGVGSEAVWMKGRSMSGKGGRSVVVESGEQVECEMGYFVPSFWKDRGLVLVVNQSHVNVETTCDVFDLSRALES